MTPAGLIGSLVGALFFCFICGFAYAFAAGDSRRRRKKTVTVALASGATGWAFAMFLPIQEFKAEGAVVIALINAIYGSHIYWFIFKPKSKTTRLIDANGRG